MSSKRRSTVLSQRLVSSSNNAAAVGMSSSSQDGGANVLSSTMTSYTLTKRSAKTSRTVVEPGPIGGSSWWILLWGLLDLFGLVLLVVAMATPDIVRHGPRETGTITQAKFQVGMLSQCMSSPVTGETVCETVGFSGMSNLFWQVGTAFVVAALFFLPITILSVVFVGCGSETWLGAARWLQMASSIVAMVAVTLIAVGFGALGDPCPSKDGGGDGKAWAQCGLQCAQVGAVMRPCILCDPYRVGYSGILLACGAMAIFIAAMFAAAVRVRVVKRIIL